MFISLAQPLVCFVHIPCTEGVFMEEFLSINVLNQYDNSRGYSTEKKVWNEIYRPYLTIQEMVKLSNNRINLKNYYKFSIVRNPYDRAYEGFKFLGSNDNFEDFLKNNRFKKPDRVYLDTMTQYLDGELNSVFKYEDYIETLSFIKMKFSFDNDLKKFPVVEKFKYSSIYEENKRLISLVNEIYYDDFKNFEYSPICL
jgi:hypothetical protein